MFISSRLSLFITDLEHPTTLSPLLHGQEFVESTVNELELSLHHHEKHFFTAVGLNEPRSVP